MIDYPPENFPEYERRRSSTDVYMMDGSHPPPSSFSTSSPASSSGLFRPRRSDDWNEYRSAIESLYRDNQLKLRDVKRIMERDHHFVASEKQYKDRLAAWHVRKNIKAKEVHVMIRKQQKRAARGKQTAFRVAGQDVDSKRIARFVRRYGASWDNNPREATRHESPEPDTPSDMSCYTPEPEHKSATLSPLSEMQPNHLSLSIFERCSSHLALMKHHRVNQNKAEEENFESLPSPEIDDNQSLSTALSPILTTDTPKPMEETFQEDPWKALDSFQERLMSLQRTLEKSMAGFVDAFPKDDEEQE